MCKAEQVCVDPLPATSISGVSGCDSWISYCANLKQRLTANLSNFSAGNIKNCRAIWESVISDPWILDTVCGYNIDFLTTPVQDNIPRPINFSLSEKTAIDIEIADLLHKGVICPSSLQDGDYVSNIFVRPKKDFTHRIILNLKRLNASVEYHHFKMDTLKSIIALMTPNCYMASLDLKDAYYTVPVHQNCRNF